MAHDALDQQQYRQQEAMRYNSLPPVLPPGEENYDAFYQREEFYPPAQMQNQIPPPSFQEGKPEKKRFSFASLFQKNTSDPPEEKVFSQNRPFVPHPGQAPSPPQLYDEVIATQTDYDRHTQKNDFSAQSRASFSPTRDRTPFQRPVSPGDLSVEAAPAVTEIFSQEEVPPSPVVPETLTSISSLDEQVPPSKKVAYFPGAIAEPDSAKTTANVLGTPSVSLPETKKVSSQSRVKQQMVYAYPPFDMLHLPMQNVLDTTSEDHSRANILEETLQSFGISAQVKNITRGPAITRFELELAAGVNVKRITSISDNIALSMASNGVRIEAPIPGKSLVGIEVPNKEIQAVTLREVLQSPEMNKAKSPLAVALGKDIAGTPIICDLSRMPHLLIAGATGSGKSVCINSI
ncbi:MAG: DNA translocase FtsK, partial [Clostridiales bacterium]|nr:DNA translocase FtsK [Clostridiales bacterium]